MNPPIVERNKLSFEAVAAIGVIDGVGRLVLCKTRQKSYTKVAYLAFLRKFEKRAYKPCKLVVDNLSFHRSEEAKEFCRNNQHFCATTAKKFPNSPFQQGRGSAQ